MIMVHTMQGEEVFINPSMIETIRTTPDTVLFLSTNKRIPVQESADEVVQLVVAYRQRVLSCFTGPEQLPPGLGTQDNDL